MGSLIIFFTQSLNTREQATAIWLVILLAWVLTKSGVRSSLANLAKALFSKKILLVIAWMLLYIAFMVFGYEMIGFWDFTALKDTLFWIVGVGFVMIVNINDAASDQKFWRRVILDSIKAIVVIEFLVNLYTFSLITELVVVPLITSAVAISAVASLKEEHSQVKALFDFLLGIFGLVILIITIRQITSDFTEFASWKNVRDLMLPIVFTGTYLPFLYLLAIYIGYELLFVRVSHTNKDTALVSYFKRKTLFANGISLAKLTQFSRAVRTNIYRDRDDVDNAIAEAINRIAH